MATRNSEQHRLAIIAVLGTLVILPVAANAHQEGRFSMLETEDGVVRLDRESGEMTTCKTSPDGWKCTPMNNAESGASERATIAKLRIEIAKLKQQLADLRNPDDTPLDEKEKSFNLPSDEEVDQAIDYMEKLLRKFGGAMKRLREDHETNDQEL